MQVCYCYLLIYYCIEICAFYASELLYASVLGVRTISMCLPVDKISGQIELS